jgi:hypothetical protein
MQRLARLTLIFAILFAVFIVGPAFLSMQFGPYPLIKYGDVWDILTPLVLIPVYWLLFQISRDHTPSQREMLAFLVLAALWVEGQGLHLAGNAIGHLTKALVGSDVDALVHFFDEVLSHYLWHIGLVGLSALLIYRQWKNPFTNERSGLRFEIVAGILHGFNYFITVVEAATAPLGVPFALLVIAITLIWGRQRLRQQPVLAFFFVAYLVATLLFLGWGLYWGGLPEFSKVGIID